MNLQEILSYRDTCLICQSQLTYYAPNFPHLLLSADQEGFHVSSSSKAVKINFRMDGTYHCNRRKSKVYEQSLWIIKGCRACSSVISWTESPRHNYTLPSLLIDQCLYSFGLKMMEDHKYEVSMVFELVQYHNQTEFYTVDVIDSQDSYVQHGIFANRVDQIFSLSTPYAINLSGIRDVDGFIGKCKTLITFS
jgi:hypothetical protein